MLDRYIEDEIMDVCEKYGMGITPFSPLAQGLLTGKYKKGRPFLKVPGHPSEGQAGQPPLDGGKPFKGGKALSNRRGPAYHAFRSGPCWILRKGISSVITGASRPEQLAQNIEASGLQLSQPVLEEIETVLDYHPFSRRIG